MRESGCYWVKLSKGGKWIIKKYNAALDKLSGDGWSEHFKESDFYEINPNRILTPDEMANLNSGE